MAKSYLILFFGMLASISVIGCSNQKRSLITPNRENLDLTKINQRLTKLENSLKNKNSSTATQPNESKALTIKSITFRIGSKDDRLRIYWSNGQKTDLPCTKEQLIWACG